MGVGVERKDGFLFRSNYHIPAHNGLSSQLPAQLRHVGRMLLRQPLLETDVVQRSLEFFDWNPSRLRRHFSADEHRRLGKLERSRRWTDQRG